MESNVCLGCFLPIVIGIMLMFAGVSVTMMGNFSKGWRDSESSSPLLIVGPVLLVAGFLMIVTSCILHRRRMKNTAQGTAVVTYSNTGQVQQQQPLSGYQAGTTMASYQSTNTPFQTGYTQPGFPQTVSSVGSGYPTPANMERGIGPGSQHYPSQAQSSSVAQTTIQGQTNYPPPPTYADATSDSNAYPEPSAPPK